MLQSYQEYHKEIDQLKQELQAARDKDGVFLPHETYNEQIKENARKEEEIKGLTKELKAKEQELEHFMVSNKYLAQAIVTKWFSIWWLYFFFKKRYLLATSKFKRCSLGFLHPIYNPLHLGSWHVRRRAFSHKSTRD